MNSNEQLNVFQKNAGLWKGTLTMVSEFPSFTYDKKKIEDQVKKAGAGYANAGDDYAAIGKAADLLYDANCKVRIAFAYYLREQYGVLNSELDKFAEHYPGPAILGKCESALKAFDDSLSHPERAEKSIKTFAMRISTYKNFVKTLADAKAEHEANLESMRKLSQKATAGATIGARERRRLEIYEQRPEIKAARQAEEARQRAEEAKQKRLAELKSQREAEIAELLSI